MGDESSGNCMTRFCHRLVRRKHLDPTTVTETKLDRCLTAFDLTALGMYRFKTNKEKRKCEKLNEENLFTTLTSTIQKTEQT